MKLTSLALLATLSLPAFAAPALSPLAEFAKCDASFYRLLGSNPELLKNANLVSKDGMANFKLGPMEDQTAGMKELTKGMEEFARDVEFQPPVLFPEGIGAYYYSERHFRSTRSFTAHDNGKEELYRWKLNLLASPKQVRSTLDKAGKLPWECEDGICTVFRQQQNAGWTVVARDRIDGNKPYLVLMLSEEATDKKKSELECELRTEGRFLPKDTLKTLRPNW
ncbi:hypothetical protein [Chitinilyticum piscinae]|uniref:Uncharacterized protein n=1 Tax=Chitinilyticum piscinae TaxID=2866724 RepID=A0A8J7FFV4_9NEIS|nr:hypothetical protein [Chitinilyticum piscinae]MBE9608275.1 hypothetical protein [Chitinilyticum piscinae]